MDRQDHSCDYKLSPKDKLAEDDPINFAGRCCL